MPVEIRFQSVRAATREEPEDAWLVFRDRVLMALLVPAETGWFLQFSLGRCEREGLNFATLAAAEIWIRDQAAVAL